MCKSFFLPRCKSNFVLSVQVYVFAHQFFYLLKILTLQIPAFIKLGSKVVEFSIPDSSYLTVKDPDPGVLANPQL